MESFKKSPAIVTKADRIRERELLRYYRPANGSAPASSPNAGQPGAVFEAIQASPDTTLTALAQLVAIRLDVRSVLIK